MSETDETKKSMKYNKLLDIAVCDLSRRFANCVNGLFEPLPIQGSDHNPYAGLIDEDKTEVLLESAFMIIAQVGASAIIGGGNKPEDEDIVAANFSRKLRTHLILCRKILLGQAESAEEPKAEEPKEQETKTEEPEKASE